MSLFNEIRSLQKIREYNSGTGEIIPHVYYSDRKNLRVDVYSMKRERRGIADDTFDVDDYAAHMLLLPFTGAAGFKKQYRLARIMAGK